MPAPGPGPRRDGGLPWAVTQRTAALAGAGRLGFCWQCRGCRTPRPRPGRRCDPRGAPARAALQPRREDAGWPRPLRHPPASAARCALLNAFAGVDIVVNAAGLATPGDAESPSLTGANALLPAVIALAAQAAGVKRLVHLSSASVQGHRRVIDETPAAHPSRRIHGPRHSGEEVLESWLVPRLGGPAWDVVTIRATSVQGPSRATTAVTGQDCRIPAGLGGLPRQPPQPLSAPSMPWRGLWRRRARSPAPFRHLSCSPGKGSP